MDNQVPAAPVPAPIPTGRTWFRLGSMSRLDTLGKNLPPPTVPTASAAPTTTQATAPPLLRPTQVPAARISEPPPPPAPLQAQRQPSPPPPPSPRVPPQVQPSALPSTMTNRLPLHEESQQEPAQPFQSPLAPPPPPQSPIRRALSRAPTPPASPKVVNPPPASPRVVNPPPSQTPPESPRFRQLPPIKTPPPSESPRVRQLQPVNTSPPPPVSHPEPEPNSQKVSNLKNSFADMRGPPSPPKKEIEAHKGKGMSSEWKKKKEADEGELKMITMAGENMGAYMELESQQSPHVNRRQLHGQHKAEESHSEDGKSKKDKGKKNKAEEKTIEAVVNSNVQSINNSIVLSSSCTTHSPGVHMAILRRKQEPKHKRETSH